LYARHAKALPPAAIGPRRLAGSRVLRRLHPLWLCVRDCPFDILHLAKPEEPMSTGTPYFVARQLPCEMCEDIPCVKACPTGALDHSLTDINKSKMGLAVLVDQETCLNFLGLRCDICYRICPVIDKAITLDPQTNPRTGKHTLFIPTVHSEHCTGCGKCEKACPDRGGLDQGISALHGQGPAEFALPAGLGGEGKGRQQPGRAGRRASYNMPEGMKYESGKGLSGSPGAVPPAPTSPEPARFAEGLPGRQAVSAIQLAENRAGTPRCRSHCGERLAGRAQVADPASRQPDRHPAAVPGRPVVWPLDRQGQPQLQLHPEHSCR
jgi:ferredoxin-type protein NapG